MIKDLGKQAIYPADENEKSDIKVSLSEESRSLSSKSIDIDETERELIDGFS